MYSVCLRSSALAAQTFTCYRVLAMMAAGWKGIEANSTLAMHISIFTLSCRSQVKTS